VGGSAAVLHPSLQKPCPELLSDILHLRAGALLLLISAESAPLQAAGLPAASSRPRVRPLDRQVQSLVGRRSEFGRDVSCSAPS
jgi:hypothetical protein